MKYFKISDFSTAATHFCTRKQFHKINVEEGRYVNLETLNLQAVSMSSNVWSNIDDKRFSDQPGLTKWCINNTPMP